MALRRWQRAPMSSLGPWLALSFLISAGLLLTILVIGTASEPDSTGLAFPG